VDACGLVSTGRTKVTGVHGESEVDTFLVNITLPNSVGFVGVPVTIGDFGKGADVLIGMSIINTGDFAVTNFNGLTKFSFRFPSEVHIDFVEEQRLKSLTPQFQHGNKRTARGAQRRK
jgi:hypothetical protein